MSDHGLMTWLDSRDVVFVIVGFTAGWACALVLVFWLRDRQVSR